MEEWELDVESWENDVGGVLWNILSQWRYMMEHQEKDLNIVVFP